ncbi:uncharacterized protein LOC107491789 [Arachis duranensis]|uniref:Uncharacterized protein LOC107491789 n=1 Tax=Arachis duranensis TaxID=130453 RepID=A0A6P4DK40_ARADU|nr:uncharacterized protein LOC107491789 [Arachis duranensis]
MAPSSASGSSTDQTITVEKSISRTRFAELGINSWPKWACPPGKYKLKYNSQQTCHLVRGKVKVYSDDSSSPAVEFCAGDLVTIPSGLSCTWDVMASVDMHYKFEPSPAPSSPPSHS